MNFEDFSEKSSGFPRPPLSLDLANTRLSPGNLGVFLDFFQNSNEKWPEMNKKWLLEYTILFLLDCTSKN